MFKLHLFCFLCPRFTILFTNILFVHLFCFCALGYLFDIQSKESEFSSSNVLLKVRESLVFKSLWKDTKEMKYLGKWYFISDDGSL
jgi:hypothetical protein